ncbi:Beta-1,2-xylosyltransferase 1 [Paramyrothecium foliicola]|nr:Beta-1,2-xylosyltransferase 1 [Paramyrothecium foliicola]
MFNSGFGGKPPSHSRPRHSTHEFQQPALCIVLFAYDIYSTRRKWTVPTPDDPDDPWRSVFDDIYDWLSGPRVIMVLAYFGTFVYTIGVHLALGQFTKSTYFCFDLIDSRATTIFLQWLSIILDAAIIVLLWRALVGARSIQLRLRTLGTLFMLSCLCIGMVALGNLVVLGSHGREPAFGSLSNLDVLADGIILVLLFVSASSWFSEQTPLAPVSMITVLLGAMASINNISGMGSWAGSTKAGAVLPLWLILGGSILFIYCQDLRSFLFLRRPVFAFLFSLLVLSATIYASTKHSDVFKARHPINDFMFAAQTQFDQWSKQVKSSTSLRAALQTYQERHDGRLPPPQFDAWFEFAKGSSVVDEFRQMEEDLRPFKDLAPHAIRDSVDRMVSYPGVASVTIKDGNVFESDTGEAGDNEDLKELAEMIRKFSKSLPDMILPINLRATPRILPTWEHTFRRRSTELEAMAHLMPREAAADSQNMTDSHVERETRGKPVSPFVSYTLNQDFGQMLVQSCPPGSRARTQPHWHFEKLCTDCLDSHSQASLFSDWQGALDVCAQPDLTSLHGFFMAKPHVPPIEELLPLFGPSKTGGFRDIIIPLPKSRLEKPDNKWQFSRRYDAPFYRGTAGKQAASPHSLRGNHKYRFLHLVRSRDPRDEVSMVLPAQRSEKDFAHEKVSTAKANAAVPFAAGIGELGSCVGENCQLLERAYGAREDAAEPLEYRYVLLLDEDEGPPTQLLRTLRSNSVPFVSTIFRTWYTERLTPWLHFVPIDLRYQALHTTFAYFSGTVDRPPINSNPRVLEEQTKNAQWIVEQGQKWTKEAIGEWDMEVYLFRLLLEWGRLINDKRDLLSFHINEAGKYVNVPWKPPGGEGNDE